MIELTNLGMLYTLFLCVIANFRHDHLKLLCNFVEASDLIFEWTSLHFRWSI